MERDDIIIALAKIQATQEEILRRFERHDEVAEKLNDRVSDLENKITYFSGMFTLIVTGSSLAIGLAIDYIKNKLGWQV